MGYNRRGGSLGRGPRYIEAREVRNAVLVLQVERDQGEPGPLARLVLPANSGHDSQALRLPLSFRSICALIDVDQGIPPEPHALRPLDRHDAHILDRHMRVPA